MTGENANLIIKTIQNNDWRYKRASHSTVLMRNRFMIIYGGWNGHEALNDMKIFDIKHEQWYNANIIGDMHSSAVNESIIYIFGGHDGKNWHNGLYYADLTEVLNAIENSLELPSIIFHTCLESGNLPSARACHTLTYYKNNLYLVGGFDGLKCHNKIHSYNIKKKIWEIKYDYISIMNSRCGHATELLDANLYILGGNNCVEEMNELIIYNLETNKCNKISISEFDFPHLKGSTCVIWRSSLIIIGGYLKNAYSSTIYMYSLNSTEWMQLNTNSKVFQRQKHSCIMYNDNKLVLFGGYNGTEWLADTVIINLEILLNEIVIKRNYNYIKNSFSSLINCIPVYDTKIILADSTAISVHKLVLISRCNYFFNMSMCSFDFPTEIKIMTERPEIIKLLINYFYTFRLDTKISHDDIYTLKKIAKKYGCFDLINVCDLYSLAH